MDQHATAALGGKWNERYEGACHWRHQSLGTGRLVGRQIVEWQREVNKAWGSLRFGNLRVLTIADQPVFEIEVFLDDLDPSDVLVQLYADGIDGGDSVGMEMTHALPDATRRCVYRVTVPNMRQAGEYTVRVIPRRDGVAIPLEYNKIAWLR